MSRVCACSEAPEAGAKVGLSVAFDLFLTFSASCSLPSFSIPKNSEMQCQVCNLPRSPGSEPRVGGMWGEKGTDAGTRPFIAQLFGGGKLRSKLSNSPAGVDIQPRGDHLAGSGEPEVELQR